MAVPAQATASQAVAVLLQHTAVASDQQIICKLLQVCKAWRTAVQESAACLTNVDVMVDREQLHLLADLGSWVASYPGLIHRIRITWPSHREWRDEEALVTVRRVLECSLQLAAAGGSAPLLAASSNAPTATATSRQLWRLAAYQNDLVATPVMLAALPTSTMTKLDLKNLVTADTAALASHLQRLSGLKDLSLISKSALSPDVTAALGTLKQLTSLSTGRVSDPQDLGLLPVQLQTLRLSVVKGKMELGHLSHLKEVTLHADQDWPDDGVVLPTQLQRLTLNGQGDEHIYKLGITELQQLEYLRIGGNMVLPDRNTMLESLVHMPRLHELHLADQRYSGPEHAHTLGGVFPTLTMLRSLEMNIRYHHAREVCQAAGLASSITRLLLKLHFTSLREAQLSDDDSDTFRFCKYLKGLVNLRDLTVRVTKKDHRLAFDGNMANGDALELTRLTGLTRLHIDEVGGVSDIIVCALATALRQLRHLSLHRCSLSIAPLPGLGLLTGLQHLNLPTYEQRDAETGLNFLMGLSQLTLLGGFSRASAHYAQSLPKCLGAAIDAACIADWKDPDYSLEDAI